MYELPKVGMIFTALDKKAAVKIVAVTRNVVQYVYISDNTNPPSLRSLKGEYFIRAHRGPGRESWWWGISPSGLILNQCEDFSL